MSMPDTQVDYEASLTKANRGFYFSKIYKFTLIFVQFTFYAYLCFLLPLYFYHDAFTHHALHVPDVPELAGPGLSSLKIKGHCH